MDGTIGTERRQHQVLDWSTSTYENACRTQAGRMYEQPFPGKDALQTVQKYRVTERGCVCVASMDITPGHTTRFRIGNNGHIGFFCTLVGGGQWSSPGQRMYWLRSRF